MMHKLSSVMGKRDDLYTLCNSIGIDEGFFEGTSGNIQEAEGQKPEDQGPKKEKRGRGSSKQSKVLVMVESKETYQSSKKYKHRPNKKVGFLKMKLMKDLTMGPINDQVISGMEKQSEVLSDGYGGYNKLKEVIEGAI